LGTVSLFDTPMLQCANSFLVDVGEMLVMDGIAILLTFFTRVDPKI
jgi:hypothetical protein